MSGYDITVTQTDDGGATVVLKHPGQNGGRGIDATIVLTGEERRELARLLLGATPAGKALAARMQEDHVGRAWVGHACEDECGCVQHPCGLVSHTLNGPCPEHNGHETIRQSHQAIDCPGGGS